MRTFSGHVRLAGTALLALSLFSTPSFAQESTSEADRRAVEGYQSTLVAVMRQVQPAFIFIGGGSGVIISPDGYFLTNHHVTKGRAKWAVFTPGGTRYQANLVGTDPKGDLSLLKIVSDRALPYVKLGNSDLLRPGQRVFAVGNPIGIGYDDYSPTFTQGIVSVVNRYHTAYTDAVQTDARINPGNSGGPLFNLRGELVGINGMIQTRFQSRVNSGVGYAISSERIKLWLPTMKAAEGGTVKHATLSGLDLLPSIAEEGAVIRRVKGSAADAGLKIGDRIVSVDGRKVWNHARLRGIIGMYPGGSEIRLRVQREEEELTISLELDTRGGAARPSTTRQPAPAAPKRAYIGGSLADAEQGGVLIERVVKDAPLDKAGLRPQDRIVQWGEAPIVSLDSLRVRLKKARAGQKVTVRVVRAGRSIERELVLSSRPVKLR